MILLNLSGNFLNVDHLTRIETLTAQIDGKRRTIDTVIHRTPSHHWMNSRMDWVDAMLIETGLHWMYVRAGEDDGLNNGYMMGALRCADIVCCLHPEKDIADAIQRNLAMAGVPKYLRLAVHVQTVQGIHSVTHLSDLRDKLTIKKEQRPCTLP